MFRRDPLLAECMPWPTGPQALLARAAVAADADVVCTFEEWRSMVNLDDPVDGGSFRLFPLVYERLRRLRSADPIMGRLKGVYRKAWSQTHTLFHKTAPALAALEAAGIRTMVIKGAPLALAYYPSVATRPAMDLDIVVRREQAGGALEILRRLGWVQGDRMPGHELPESHAMDLHNGDGQEIDLHWHCLREAPAAASDSWFWTSATPLDFCGVQTLQPSPTALLLHTILHGVRSNKEPPLRWIADAITILQQRTIDWNGLVQFATSQRLSYRLLLGLDFLRQNYAAAIPADVLERLRANGRSLVERMENVVYLGDADQMYRPLLFPFIDYWRFLRNERTVRFIVGYGRYLQRRWRLAHATLIPVAALRALTRRLVLRHGS